MTLNASLACQSAWWPGHSGRDPCCVGCRNSGSLGYRKLLGTRNLSFPLVTFVGTCGYVCCFTVSKLTGKAKDLEALVRPKDGISGRQETQQTNHSLPKMGMVEGFDPRQPACNEGRLASSTSASHANEELCLYQSQGRCLPPSLGKSGPKSSRRLVIPKG